MLARVLAIALCPCLCLYVTSRCSIETDGRINLVVGKGVSFDQSYTVFYGHLGISKNKVTSLFGTLS